MTGNVYSLAGWDLTVMADIHIYAPLCISAGAVLPVVCVSLLAARFYARRRQKMMYELDGWLFIQASVTASLRLH